MLVGKQVNKQKWRASESLFTKTYVGTISISQMSNGLLLKLSDRSEILQPSLQHRCRLLSYVFSDYHHSMKTRPNWSSMVASQVVVMTTFGATCNETLVLLTILGFQWLNWYYFQISVWNSNSFQSDNGTMWVNWYTVVCKCNVLKYKYDWLPTSSIDIPPK